MKSASTCGAPPRTSSPAPARRVRTSGICRAVLNSWFRRAITCGGVAAGASTPYQALTSTLGTPCSVAVGTSGNRAERDFSVTASATSLPDRMCGTAPPSAVNNSLISPPTAAVIDGPTPLYGTCSRSTRVERLNISPAKCMGEPLPGLPYGKPGVARAASSIALRLFTPIWGLATSTSGVVAGESTGTRSLCTSTPPPALAGSTCGEITMVLGVSSRV